MFNGLETSSTTATCTSNNDKNFITTEESSVDNLTQGIYDSEYNDKTNSLNVGVIDGETDFVPDADDIGEPWTLEDANYCEETISEKIESIEGTSEIDEYVATEDDISEVDESIENEDDICEIVESVENEEHDINASTLSTTKTADTSTKKVASEISQSNFNPFKQVNLTTATNTLSISAAPAITAAVDKTVTSAADLAQPNQKIPYARNIMPISGNFSMGAAAIKWNDKNPDSGAMSSAAHSTAQIYKKISKGNITIPVKTKTVRVPYNHARKNLNRAQNIAKKALGNCDTYAIMNSGLIGSSAGSNTMTMEGSLKRTWYHERGHADPFKFGHAGKPGDAYGDPSSFMGRFPCNNVNGPQEYAAGWAGDFKTGLYNIADGLTIDYPIESRFTKSPNPQNITGVLIPRAEGTEGRDMFLSTYPSKNQLLFGLYLTNSGGKGTTLVKSFSKKAQYDKLMFERITNSDNNTAIRISPYQPR